MLNKPAKASRTTPDQQKHAKFTTLQTAQHGDRHQSRNSSSLSERGSPLLDVPGESLTHITSYLDVPALLNLSRVNKSLHEHVDNDSTWHRALLCQFLEVSPESDPQGAQGLVLRRIASTWKRELVYRHITGVCVSVAFSRVLFSHCTPLHSRWERSRASAITYSPLTGQINDIRLVSENGLLTLSTQFGIVCRSNPLSGKIFRGSLDAAGTLNGLGIWNPNAEFSPNVCLCRIFSEKSTAKILWGFTHGEIAVTTANKVADPSRTSPAKFSRSLISEQHIGTVVDGVWGEGGDVFLTAGIDGKVKLWEAAKIRCLWTSSVSQELLSPTSFPSRLDFHSKKGIVVAAFSGGGVVIWWGLSPLYTGNDLLRVNEFFIPLGSNPPPTAVSHLILDTGHHVSLLVHHVGSAHFYRHNVDLITGEVETIKFGEETDRSIKSLKLISAVQATASPFVLTGDWLGSLSIYDWSSPHEQKRDFVQPARQITAFDDGEVVSSIEWNPWVTATGSSTGAVKVWDSLKFTLLRTFQPHARGNTGDPLIALEREMIVIAFGEKVTTWKAGPVRKGNKVLHPSKKGKNNALAKWRRKPGGLVVPYAIAHQCITEQVDMYRDISESQREIEEEQSWKRAAYGREKDHLGSLEALGLNEQEALEYVLMLSRDEEDRLDRASENPTIVPSSTRSHPIPSSSNSGVQASPRVKLDAWSAGSPESPEIAPSVSTGSDLSDEKQFPAVGESVLSLASGISGTTTPVKFQRPSASPPSAWNTPLKSPSEPGTASPKRVTVTPVSNSTPPPTTRRNTEREYQSRACEESQEDRDLKLAIELSLAEAANDRAQRTFPTR